MSSITELLCSCPLNGHTIVMSYIFTTIALWAIFFLLVPFKEWRKYYSTLLFAALLGTISDLLGVVLDQWAYYGPVVGTLSLWSDLGIAPAEAGIFIRLFPSSQNNGLQIGYWILWAVVNATFEWFFVWVGWIGYDHWNPIRAGIFYLFFFGAIWAQEYWYNGAGRLRIKN
jgi:hypothetical protein